MYVPYALLLGGGVIEVVEMAVLIAVVDGKIVGETAKRMLTVAMGETIPINHLYIVLGLLAAGMALNYLLNLVFLVVFARYIRPMMQKRQIDIVSNYATLIFGMVTTYRFYLLAFSRLFKQPHV
jgi:hypothetical protein